MIDSGSEGRMYASATIVAFAVWGVRESYTTLAPSLSELRDTHRDATVMRQKLLDADVCTLGLALTAGVLASWLAQSPIPILATSLSLGWLSWYHHAVLNGFTPKEIEAHHV